MAITLREDSHTAKVLRTGQDPEVSIPVGKSLVVETTPGGEEILKMTCPSGKVWTARVIVEITETDA
jgi:hypothetical protein